MHHNLWDEYARLQRIASDWSRFALPVEGFVADLRLTHFLSHETNVPQAFDLKDCRRRMKNLARNRTRRERERLRLLALYVRARPTTCYQDPADPVMLREEVELVKRHAGRDWPLLLLTLEGEYEAVAARTGMPVGTLKSRVSRCKQLIRAALLPVSTDCA